MKEYKSQSHVRYECKYHIVWYPKYRRKKLYGRLRQQFGKMMHELCRQKGVELIEGRAMKKLMLRQEKCLVSACTETLPPEPARRKLAA